MPAAAAPVIRNWAGSVPCQDEPRAVTRVSCSGVIAISGRCPFPAQYRVSETTTAWTFMNAPSAAQRAGTEAAKPNCQLPATSVAPANPSPMPANVQARRPMLTNSHSTATPSVTAAIRGPSTPATDPPHTPIAGGTSRRSGSAEDSDVDERSEPGIKLGPNAIHLLELFDPSETAVCRTPVDDPLRGHRADTG